jgi:hypothetical protein
MVDALVPPSRPILRCDHGEEAHVNQSRYPTMVTRAFYCYRYMIVSIFFLEFDYFYFYHSIVNVIE